MAGVIGVKFKLMPSSLDVNLEEIKENAKEIIESKKGMRLQISEQLIAFGLKATILFFQLAEEGDLNAIEEALKNIENVQSVEITDIRKIA